MQIYYFSKVYKYKVVFCITCLLAINLLHFLFKINMWVLELAVNIISTARKVIKL